MIGNGLGSLSGLEAAVVLAILYLKSVAMFFLAVRLFQYGSISYTSRVNVRTALSNRRSMGAAAGQPTEPNRGATLLARPVTKGQNW
jgi:ABC-2 type transport system permease protein